MPLDGSSPWFWQFSCKCAVINTLLKTQGGPSEDLQGSLSVHLSPLRCYTLHVQPSLFCLTESSALSPELRESCSTCTFPPFAVAWELSQGRNCSNHRTSLVSHLPETIILCCLIPVSWKSFFMYFVCYFWFFWAGKLSPVMPSWPE